MPRGTPVTLAPPTRGANVNVVEPQIPEGFVWKSQNMIDRYGQFRTRQGESKLIPTALPSRCLGGALFTDGVGLRHLVAVDLEGIYTPAGTAWQDITGLPAPLHGDPDHPAHFTTFSISGTKTLILTNNVDTLRKWDGVAATFSELGGSPPEAARDIDVCFNRVLAYNVVEGGIRSSARLRISAFNDPNSWPSNLVIDLTDTGDDGVAVRTLTRSTFLCYNTNSIWIGSGQAGTFPFVVDILQPEQPGPMSPAAIVSARGVHYYLGRDFRLYAVSQLGVQNLSEQTVSRVLQARVCSVCSSRTFGVYRPSDQTVWFFYVSSATGSGHGDDPDEAVSFNINTGAIHFHTFPFSLSTGWPGESLPSLTWLDLVPFQWNTLAATYPTWESMGGTLVPTEFLGGVSGYVYRSFYDLDDDGQPVVMQWEFPPRFLGGPRNVTEFDGIENTFETPPGGALVAVDVGVTETAAEAGGPTYTQIGTHDTSAPFAQPLTYAGIPPIRGRLMNWRYRCTSSIPVKFKGAIAYVVPEERPS